MHQSPVPPRFQELRALLATVWPATVATDSKLQRQKKIALRGGQLAVVAVVALAVAGRIVSGKHPLPWPQAAGLTLAGLLYIIWYLYGLRQTVQWALWERGTSPPPDWPPPLRRRLVFYFAIQLGLAGLICLLTGAHSSAALVWLVLLPPVAQSVFMLSWPGIVMVAALCPGILVVVAWWQGWNSVPGTLLEFSYAMAFTLVLSLQAVSAEKARSEVEQLVGKLSGANQKLHEYSLQAGELAATRERNRMAREIHDSLGHYLTVVNMQIEAARALQGCDPVRTRDALEKAQALTQQGLQDIRRSVAALRTPPLDDQPLAEALRQIVADSCTTGQAVELQVCGEARVLLPPARLTLYRAGQEGLTNVRKHARASQVRLVLDFCSPTKTCLSVTDNGDGAVSDATRTDGFGLLGLRERVQLLGGAVQVQTAPGAGFSLKVEVPG